jgi:RND superfamily putative drug exporter
VGAPAVKAAKLRGRVASRRPDALGRLGIAMARRHRRVFAGWLAAAVIGLLGLPHLLGSLTSPPMEVAGSESARAGEVLRAGLPALGNEAMLAVLHSPGLKATDPLFRSAIKASTAALAGQPGVVGVLPLPVAGNPPPPFLAEVMEPLRGLSHDEHTAYLAVGAIGEDRQRQDNVPAQRTAADDAARRASGGAVRAYLLGASPFGQAVQQTEIHDLTRIELVAVPLAVVVLLLGLRAPVAALVPVAVAGTAVLATVGMFALLTGVCPVDGMLVIGVNAVGLGAGVDYALFVVSRFREELAAGAAPEVAVGRALSTSGRTVVYSGLIVTLAAASLFLVRWHVFTEFAVGTMAVIAATMAASLTLLPATLICVAGRMQWRPRWLRAGTAAPSLASEGRLAGWARHLMRHPWPYAVGVTAGLALLAVPAAGLTLDINLERRALADTAYGQGLAVLERDVPGYSGMTYVLVRRPSSPAEPDTGLLATALRTDPMVAAVTKMDNRADLTALLVIPTEPADSPHVIELAHRIRDSIAPTTAPAGTTMVVGGPAALVADIVTETALRLWWVVGAILALMFALLVAMLRSVVLPAKAIAMNLLATGAAFGLTALLFRPAVLWPQVPVVVFALLFALSMDYEMFLVRRIQEDYQATCDNTNSVATGLQRTARPISLAAAILAVAFGSLLTSQITGLRQLGFAIAAALIIDATLIRLVLVPTLMQIMGRWNWWLPTVPRRTPRRNGCPPSRTLRRSPPPPSRRT